MPTVLSIDPVTRLEGHLKIEVAVEITLRTSPSASAGCARFPTGWRLP
jgi:Ni,Fe-hydrogenase I large subunit